MKKFILSVAAAMTMVVSSQASLVGLGGMFVDGSSSFTYDGKLFQDGWAIQVYSSPSSVVDFNFSLSALYQTTVNVNSGALPFENFVNIDSVAMDLPNNSYIYSVLFDNAVPANSMSYLLLDTVALDVGAHDPQAAYTPGNPIPTSGTVQFNGQAWQPMAVPEPATMGLLGLGGLALVLRRKMRK